MLKLENHWYRAKLTFLTMLLLPLSWLFGIVVSLRRFIYRIKLKKSHRFPVPVIIVGNITVGGTGKTPLVIWLAQFLKANGYKPGIVSRGIGGEQQKKPCWVSPKSNPREVGDEAVLLAKRSDCPVVICINRVAAVKSLLEKSDCNMVISDDGLQHYALARDVEIALIDGARGLGNQCLLPAGPLREKVSRLKQVDFIVKQGVAGKNEIAMQLQGDHFVSLQNEQLKKPVAEFAGQRVHAMAGIGNPERFFSQLRKFHLNLIEHVFPDHYLYKKDDVNFGDELPVMMTEKDAVKCKNFVSGRHWYLPVSAAVDIQLGKEVLEKINQKGSL